MAEPLCPPEESGDESRMWGLHLAQLNTREGDPREAPSPLDLCRPVSVTSMETDSHILSVELNQFQNPVQIDEPECIPLFPLQLNQCDMEDKHEILEILLTRTFKDFCGFDFNLKGSIIGDAASKLASELGIKAFRTPGEKWIKAWKKNCLRDPYALSFGWQVGRIVDTKEGDVLHRIVYLTGKSIRPVKAHVLATSNCRFQAGNLQVPFEDFIGRRCLGEINHGRLKVVFWIKSLKDGILKAMGRRTRQQPWSTILGATEFQSVSTSRAYTSRTRRPCRGDKNMEAVLRYNEACDARISLMHLLPQAELAPDASFNTERALLLSDAEMYHFNNAFTVEELSMLFAEEDETLDLTKV